MRHLAGVHQRMNRFPIGGVPTNEQDFFLAVFTWVPERVRAGGKSTEKRRSGPVRSSRSDPKTSARADGSRPLRGARIRLGIGWESVPGLALGSNVGSARGLPTPPFGPTEWSPATAPAGRACTPGASPNTVEIGASHSLLLLWVYSRPKQQGGYDSHATRTMHAAARCVGPDLGQTGGTGTGYRTRRRFNKRSRPPAGSIRVVVG